VGVYVKSNFLKVSAGVNFAKTKMGKSILRKISLVAIFVLALFFFSSSVTSAQDPSSGGLVPCGVTTPCTLCHFIIGFHKLVLYGTYLVTALALLALVLTGVAYILSSGNEGLMTTAKGFLKGSFIGFAVVLGGFLIITAALWVVSANGDLGIGHTGGWASFSCSVASSALNPVTAVSAPTGSVSAAPGPAAPAPGTIGGVCGANNLGKCTAAPPGSTAFNACSNLGKIWMSAGTNCSASYCCADKIPLNGDCMASGVAGKCKKLFSTGGQGPLASVMGAVVCDNPNRSQRMEQAPFNELLCEDGLGCCDPKAPPMSGILYSPCGTGGVGTCRAAGSINISITACASQSPQQVPVSGDPSCREGLWCCAAPGAGSVSPGPDITP
jgi:hypothetical protein